MLAHYILAGVTFSVLFVLFLVIARTLNSIINLLTKLEYIVQKEFDLKSELVEVHRLMDAPSVEAASGAKAAPDKPSPSR